MKKIFTIIALMMVCAFANAQGMLRSIIFADNNDDRIGKGVQCNMDWIQEEIDIIASCIGMEDKEAAPLVFEQFNCNPQNLRQCIKNFKCGNDDIVLFFYFGHGGRSTQDRSEFPQMCLGRNYLSQNDQWIPLEDVKSEIMKQNPRFLLVIGDCCNSSDPGISPKFRVLTSAAATEITSTQKAAMKRLFLNCRGAVIASGSTKGEVSWYYNTTAPDGGGFFTKAFQNELENYTAKKEDADWKTLLERVKNAVVKECQDIKQIDPDMTIQTPHFKIEVNYGPTPNPNKNNETKNMDQNNNQLVDNNNNQRVNNNDFQSVLVDIASERNTPSYRINRRSVVLSHFAHSNVWVDIVGRNNKTIVSSERASDFVERISTAFHLRNFTILDCQRDGSGKITALKVHEIYER